MGNRPYLRTILGGTDFKSLSLMEKIICINVVLFFTFAPRNQVRIFG